jgi:thiol-disulfide isomerase/thioredoxin
MKHHFAVIIAVFMLWGCSDKPVQSPTGTILRGTLKNTDERTLVLVQALGARDVTNIDTLELGDNGDFVAALNVPKPGYYRLFVADNNFCNIILGPNDTLQIEADVRHLEDTYLPTGSDETIKLKELNDMMNRYVSDMEVINAQMQQAQAQQNFSMYQTAYDKQMRLNYETGQKIKTFVVENTASLAAISAVQKLDPEQEMPLFEKVAANLAEKAGDSEVYQDLVERIASVKRLMPGAIMDDITLSTPDGQTMQLSKVQGKLILVDFWASWCKPCRAENPNVVKAYNKYKGKGFNIVGISLDQQKGPWLSAIATDRLVWPQMSDLKGWESAAARQYNITSIPMSFLIDSERRIIAKNLRGDALSSKIEEVLAAS